MSERILIIGDVMLDRYVHGVTTRPNPEVAGGTVFSVESVDERLGGAAAVAFLCAGFGARVSLNGSIGLDAEGDTVTSLCADNGIEWRGCRNQEVTTVKQRYVERGALVGMRVDRDCNSISGGCDPTLGLDDESFECIVVSDYGRGVVSDGLIRSISYRLPGVPIIVDPARDRDWRIYEGASIVKCNEFEAFFAQSLPGCRLIVTREGGGMDLDGVLFPTKARPVIDPAGCGDTVAAVLALCLSRGRSIEEGCRLANAAAGLQVQRLGVQRIAWSEMMLADSKVADQQTVAEFARSQKAAGRRVVFTNGCYDVLHAGHVDSLNRAKAIGDVLIVGLNSDSSVRRLKGEPRPIHTQEHRAAVLAALECVDAVVVFDGEPSALIKAIRPEVLVKGEDYCGKQIAGSEFADRVELLPLIDGLSSTAAIAALPGNC